MAIGSVEGHNRALVSILNLPHCLTGLCPSIEAQLRQYIFYPIGGDSWVFRSEIKTWNNARS